MSRGLGVIQRSILDTLWEQQAGASIYAYQFGGNTRRAAHTLARRGLVRIEYRHLNGRRYMVIRPQRGLRLTLSVRESHKAEGAKSRVGWGYGAHLDLPK